MPVPYTKEQIEQANRVNLIEYARNIGYDLEKRGNKSLHVKNSGGLYLFEDSNKYYHFTSDKKGGVIDFVMQFEGKTFLDAVEHLLQRKIYNVSYAEPNQKKYEKKEKGILSLPEKAKNYKRVYWYLCTVRGIEPEIVSKLMREKKIYQEAYKGNCVFVGYDENKSPKYCSKRGTSLEKPFKGDQDNSDKSYPFSMEGMSEWLFVLESPIDVMSHATLTKLHGSDYRIDHRISLGCLSDVALERYLSIHPKIKRIIFALDDDANGKAPDGSSYNHGQEAALRLYKKYEQKGYLVLMQIPEGKDFNDELMVLRSKMATLETSQDDIETEDEDEDSLSL